MTRLIVAITLIFLLILPLSAQMTQQQESILKPHVEKTLADLANREKECQDLEKKYQDAETKKQELETKLAQVNSFFTKKKLQIQYLLAKKSAENAQKSWHAKQIELVLCYCGLHAFGKRAITAKEMAKARQYQGDIDQCRQGSEEQLAENEKLLAQTDAKLAEITDNQQKRLVEITRLELELKKFEVDKTWGNLKDRMAVKSKIAMQKTGQLSLNTQQKYYNNKRQNCLTLQPILKIRKAAAEVALAVIKNGKPESESAKKGEQK